MATGPFKNSSLGWQLQQLQQRLGEWWELQWQRLTAALSNLSPLFQRDFSWLGTITQIILWIVVGLLLIGIAWRTWQRFRPYFKRLSNKLSQPVNSTSKTPAQDLSVSGWLRRSQQFQQQGNYDQACQCLYFAMLEQLNARGIIPHQASRTDGEYLQLTQQFPHSRPYQTLFMAHQQLCFGNRQASLSLWEQCQQAYREIEAP
jgi:hypothetical protein